MPSVVVKLPVHRLHKRLEGAGAQVDDEPDGAALQRQVDVVCRFPGVQHQAVALERSEGQRDLVRAALDGSHGQIVTEELVPLEGGHRFFCPYRDGERAPAFSPNQEHKPSHRCPFDERLIHNIHIDVWFVMIGQYLKIWNLRVQKHLNI